MNMNKAPDKIYINGFSAFATVPVKEGIEYLRKDALLEWASDRLGMVSDLGFDDGDVEHGYIRALQDLIDKLNSL